VGIRLLVEKSISTIVDDFVPNFLKIMDLAAATIISCRGFLFLIFESFYGKQFTTN
jgi:hypothetical protein